MPGLSDTGLGLLAGLMFPAAMACAQPVSTGIDPALVTGDRQPVPFPQPDMASTGPIAVDVVTAPTSDVGSGVFVGAISVGGLQQMNPADFSDIVTTHIGRELAPTDLANLANAVADRIRARGYPFATAAIPPQSVNSGVLVVSADEGRIDEVRFDGPLIPAVAAALAPLVGTGPVKLSEVERRLMLATDTSGVRIEGTRFLREGGRGILLVRAARDPAVVRVALSNQGTRTIGPVQLRIDADLNGLFDRGDKLSLSYATTPAQPCELQFGRIRYAHDLDSADTEIALAASVSTTHPGSYLSPYDFRTRSWTVSASIARPLLRRPGASFWLEGELGVRNFAQWRTDTRIRHDRLATFRLTLSGNVRLAGGRWRMSTTVTRGLGILGASVAGDPLATRNDADGTFTALSAWSDWTRPLGHGFSIRLGAQGQLAVNPLPLSEEITLGGTGFLRGYDWGERSGDEGAMGLAELRYLVDHPFGLVRRAQFYGFADGGVVSNLGTGIGGGALASVGGGVRADLTGRIGATFEVAVPLSGPRYDTGDRAAKLNIGLISTF